MRNGTRPFLFASCLTNPIPPTIVFFTSSHHQTTLFHSTIPPRDIVPSFPRSAGIAGCDQSLVLIGALVPRVSNLKDRHATFGDRKERDLQIDEVSSREHKDISYRHHTLEPAPCRSLRDRRNNSRQPASRAPRPRRPPRPRPRLSSVCEAPTRLPTGRSSGRRTW